MRRTKEDAELTRQSLLEAALQVFSQKGYDATRLEDVAEAARVTRGAIYHHFGGKVELFRALVEEASQAGEQVVERAIREGGDFLTVARHVLIYTLDLLQTNSQYRRVMTLYLFRASGSPELADYQRQRLVEMDQQVEQVAGFFRIAISQGQLPADLDPKIAAKAFLAYQSGLAIYWLMNPAMINIDTEAEALADILLWGIAGKEGKKSSGQRTA